VGFVPVLWPLVVVREMKDDFAGLELGQGITLTTRDGEEIKGSFFCYDKQQHLLTIHILSTKFPHKTRAMCICALTFLESKILSFP
jgi:hypothetical protein